MSAFPPSDKTFDGLVKDMLQRITFLERRLGGLYVPPEDQSMATLRLTSTADLSLTSTDHAFQVGPTGGLNMAMDDNEMMARNNGAASTFAINIEGGNVTLGNASSTVSISGNPNFTKTNNRARWGSGSTADIGNGSGRTITVTFPAGSFTATPACWILSSSARLSYGILAGTSATQAVFRFDNWSGATATAIDYTWGAVGN